MGLYGVTDKENGIYNKIIPEEFNELSVLSYDTTKNTGYEVEMIKVKKTIFTAFITEKKI